MSENKVKKIQNGYYTGERPLFHGEHLEIGDTIFGEGESPLKESSDITLKNSMFQWKYPLWYSKNVVAQDCTWAEMARAGVWYTDNLQVKNALIEAPKNFRRCKELTLEHVFLPHAEETLWNCQKVTMKDCLLYTSFSGTYFFRAVATAPTPELNSAKYCFTRVSMPMAWRFTPNIFSLASNASSFDKMCIRDRLYTAGG